jgi:hypothetical protein
MFTDLVIPGWSEGPDPESRDSGFALPRPGRRFISNTLVETITGEVKPAMTFAGA